MGAILRSLMEPRMYFCALADTLRTSVFVARQVTLYLGSHIVNIANKDADCSGVCLLGCWPEQEPSEPDHWVP